MSSVMSPGAAKTCMVMVAYGAPRLNIALVTRRKIPWVLLAALTGAATVRANPPVGHPLGSDAPTYPELVGESESRDGRQIEFIPPNYLDALVAAYGSAADMGVVYYPPNVPGQSDGRPAPKWQSLGLQGALDPSRKVLILRPAWYREDDRDAGTLLAFLKERKPGSEDDAFRKLDAWRIALDALLSKAVNFDRVWLTRVEESLASQMMIELQIAVPVRNMFVGTIRAENGHPMTLILDQSVPAVNPGPESVAFYYLVDSAGKITDSGKILPPLARDFWFRAKFDTSASGLVGVRIANFDGTTSRQWLGLRARKLALLRSEEVHAPGTGLIEVQSLMQSGQPR